MDYRISQKEIDALADAAGMLNVLRVSAVSVVSLEIYEPEDVAATLHMAIHAMNTICEDSQRIAA